MKRLLRVLPILLMVSSTMAQTADLNTADDSDLRVVRAEVADKDNAITYINLAAKALYFPPAGVNINDVVYGLKWDEKIAAETLEKNTQAFEQLERAFACSQGRLPETTNCVSDVERGAQWRKLAKVMTLRAEWFLRHDSKDAAVKQAIQLIQFAHLLKNSGSLLVDYLIAHSIESIGLIRIEKMVVSGAMSPSAFGRYCIQLRQYENDEEALRTMCRLEYQLACMQIDAVYAGNFRWLGFQEDIDSWRMNRMRTALQPNQTKQRVATSFRDAIGQISKPESCRQGLIPMTNSFVPNELLERTTWLTTNGVGNVLYEWSRPRLATVLRLKSRQDSHFAGLRLVLALKSYEKDRGELPATLSNLVPHYLEKVPADPFDGKPMRYDAKKRIVYSVGEDLSDSGGSTNVLSTAGTQWRWTAEDAVFDF